ncbi:MAG: helix-turn-helix transcriptional regulator [Gammaproteobacteria bacterium]
MAKRDYLTQTELMILLAILRLKDEAYGVPISAEILARTGREVATASVYAILERLEVRGLVRSQLGEATAARGGRAKTYFRLTAKGVSQVRETQDALQQLWRGLSRLK